MTYRKPIFSSFLLALSLLLQQSLEAKGPPDQVTVTGAVPGEATQGEEWPVVISGDNFDAGSTVRFLVSGTQDEKQIEVGVVGYNPDGTLTAEIVVAPNAEVSEYDIEVRNSSGRRGKGTSLFRVKQKPSDITVSCDEFFGLPDGTCTEEGGSGDCLLTPILATPTGMEFTQHCDTRAMLKIPSGFSILHGEGFRLNLVAPWSGDYAGISHSQGGVRIAEFVVRATDPAVAGGCGLAGGVQTAILIDPDQPFVGLPRPQAEQNVIVTGNGARFCNAIENVGSDPSIRVPRFAGGIVANTIMPDSYEHAGIRVANQNLTDNVTGDYDVVHTDANIVHATSSPCAVGILIGPAVERASVDENEVHASNGDATCGETAGIVVMDAGRNQESPLGLAYDFLEARPVEVSRNVIYTGGWASGGVAFDADTSAVAERNAVSAGHADDFGFCLETGSEVDIPTKRNFRNSFTGFATGNEIVSAPDCGVASP